LQTAAAIVQAKQAVIFDLFHTLTTVESTWAGGGPTTCEILGVSREAWRRQLLEQSRDRLVGRQRDPVGIITQMARAINPSIPDARIHAAVANRVERFAAALVNVPAQTCRVLQALRAQGKILGLLSNADVMEVAAWNRSPLAPLFDTAVFSCEAGCAKPYRETYDLCLRRLGVQPDRAVFIGDVAPPSGAPMSLPLLLAVTVRPARDD
jgi:putative hydrolase of the HAD superfamily